MNEWLPVSHRFQVQERYSKVFSCHYMLSTNERTVLQKVELELLKQKTDFCDGSFYNALLSAYYHSCPMTITTSEDPFDYCQQPFQSW